MFSFQTSIKNISTIPLHLRKKLNSLGIETVEDLLYYFPFRYEDFSVFKNIGDLSIGETVTVRGKIEKIKTTKTWKKRLSITEAYLNDETGLVKVVWFNFPGPIRFLSSGKYIQISGKISMGKDSQPYFQHPNFQLISKKIFESNELPQKNNLASTGMLVPVYSETKGLTSFILRRLIKNILEKTNIYEIIPKDILLSQKLPDLETALWQIHFPSSTQEATLAKKRFAFEKMFLLQIKVLQAQKIWDSNKAISLPFNEEIIKFFVSRLPFMLTSAQRKSAWQIIKDLEKTKPMNRLLEGDVGSGKTVVSALASLSVISHGYQVALMAPTEVLAIQHFNGICNFFSNSEFSIALLTGSKKKISKPSSRKSSENLPKKELLSNLSIGEIDLIIGTHALLQEKVRFKNLALVIVDEQHRFGVNQRAFLQQQTLNLDDGMKETIPHLLTMTATPIPRTLSLAIFGNLDLSIIDEYPKGRKKIITKVVLASQREEVYEFIRKEIFSGRQAFIICPLVEESSKISEVKAATKEFERLKEKIFPKLSIGLLHGKMKSKEKDEIMQDFKGKKYDILVSTSVVEVGVDVPNATIMLIEGAERFGLSQLHQFRGRVGRGEHQSYCFLFTTNGTSETTSRLRAMEKTNDGFKIAEYDLKLRGPGQFLGTLQSGTPDIAMQSLSDLKTIQSARIEAQRILAFDPKLENFPLLKKQVEKLQNLVHWE